jgi:glycosyltransferase involved in cell wall biosynthesis
MFTDKLEILLITYNRSAFLAKTLGQLSRGVFSQCKITILDNCSDDGTRKVCDAIAGSFPKFRFCSSKVNIGGNANYLKAIELSLSEYTWILCDDDDLDFSDCSDVVNAIESGKFDLIEVGVQDKGTWPRNQATTVQSILASRLDYYSRMTFFPAFIFRTVLFDSSCFCSGYKNIDHLYPQFEFLNKSMRENFSIYLAKNRIVRRNESCDQAFLPLKWFADWVICCQTIADKSIRYRTIEEVTIDKGFFKGLAFWTILERKLCNDGLFWIRVLFILRGFNYTQRLKYLLVFPLAFLPIPLSFWTCVRSYLYKVMNVPPEEIPPLNFIKREPD